MVSERPTASARPRALGTKLHEVAIWRIRLLVASLMRGESLRARDAVERETPAAAATSASVAFDAFDMVTVGGPPIHLGIGHRYCTTSVPSGGSAHGIRLVRVPAPVRVDGFEYAWKAVNGRKSAMNGRFPDKNEQPVAQRIKAIIVKDNRLHNRGWQHSGTCSTSPKGWGWRKEQR